MNLHFFSLLWLGFVLVVWFAIMSSIRRLHDLGMTGWWLFLTWIPIIGSLILTVLLGFVRGDKEPNKYGNPLNSVKKNTRKENPR